MTLSPLSRRAGRLETATVVHLGAFLIATSWAFGGNASWVTTPLSLFGSLGALITVAAVWPNIPDARSARHRLRQLWPFALFNGVVLISLLTPGYNTLHLGGETFLAPAEVPAWRPSAAQPAVVGPLLWLFDAIYLSCFNLVLVVRHRRLIRGLLLAIVANALLLAIFGTAQKLSRSPGLFFGRVPSPQGAFFASFIYHNHWGAFIVLMSAACLALVWHYARHNQARNFLHSHGFTGLVVLVFLVASVPLSTSRSCTLLLLLLLAAAFLQWLVRLRRERRRSGEGTAAPLLGAAAAIALALGAIWLLDRETIVARASKTVQQVAEIRGSDATNSRLTLYSDTWRMAEARLWFGWGMGSYPSVFYNFNTDQGNSRDHLPKYYHDAHNDWVQSAAEHGLIGTVLLGLCALVPLSGIRRQQLAASLPRYLLAGCGLVLLYAWVEFPFGNVAVVLSWWLVFFCAVRYAQLQQPEPARK